MRASGVALIVSCVVACGKARRRGQDCMGVIYTSWSGRWGGLAALAEAAWRLPR